MESKGSEQERYLYRTIHLSLLFMMQVCFTVYSLCILVTIETPIYLWIFWVVYQMVGWTFFLFQFYVICRDARRIMELQQENDELKGGTSASVHDRLAKAEVVIRHLVRTDNQTDRGTQSYKMACDYLDQYRVK